MATHACCSQRKIPAPQARGFDGQFIELLAHFHGCTNAIGFILAAIVIVAERGVIANALAVFPSILERFVAVIAFIARVPAVLTTYLMARVPMTGLVTIVNICFVSMADEDQRFLPRPRRPHRCLPLRRCRVERMREMWRVRLQRLGRQLRQHISMTSSWSAPSIAYAINGALMLRFLMS
jgi:hypothetical protein